MPLQVGYLSPDSAGLWESCGLTSQAGSVRKSRRAWLSRENTPLDPWFERPVRLRRRAADAADRVEGLARCRAW